MTNAIARCEECLQQILPGETYQSTDDGSGRRYRHRYHQLGQFLPGRTGPQW